MEEAGVSMVSVGIFSWASVEPRAGRVRLRLVRRGDGPAGRRRRRGLPGHHDGLAAALAHPRCTRRCCPYGRTARGSTPGARQHYCPSSPVYRELRRAAGRAGRRRATAAIRRWRCGTSATSTAATSGLLLRRVRGGLPALAARPVRRGRRAQRGVVDRVLVAAVRRLRGGAAAALAADRSPTRRSSWTSPGSPPTRCWPATWPRRRCCDRRHPGRAGHDQLLGRAAKPVDPCTWAPHQDVVSLRLLPRSATIRTRTCRGRLRLRPDALAARRAAVDADGAGARAR